MRKSLEHAIREHVNGNWSANVRKAYDDATENLVCGPPVSCDCGNCGSCDAWGFEKCLKVLRKVSLPTLYTDQDADWVCECSLAYAEDNGLQEVDWLAAKRVVFGLLAEYI